MCEKSKSTTFSYYKKVNGWPRRSCQIKCSPYITIDALKDLGLKLSGSGEIVLMIAFAFGDFLHVNIIEVRRANTYSMAKKKVQSQRSRPWTRQKINSKKIRSPDSGRPDGHLGLSHQSLLHIGFRGVEDKEKLVAERHRYNLESVDRKMKKGEFVVASP